MATILGRNSLGDTVVGVNPNRLFVTKFTLASAGTITELHGFFRTSGSGNFNIKVVVYADNAGSPIGGALIAASSSSLVNNSSYVDYSKTGLSVSIAAGTYWVGSVGDGTGDVSTQTGGGSDHYAIQTTAGNYTSPPNPFPGGDSEGTGFISATWAVVTTGSTFNGSSTVSLTAAVTTAGTSSHPATHGASTVTETVAITTSGAVRMVLAVRAPSSLTLTPASTGTLTLVPVTTPLSALTLTPR